MIGEMFNAAGETTKDPRMARAMVIMIDEIPVVAQCTGNEIWSEKLH